MSFSKKDKFNKTAHKLQNGSQFAAEEIFNHFSPKFFGYFMTRVSHRETAEDLTQTVFLKIASNIKTFDKEKGNFSTWAWQISQNTLTDYYRSKRPVLLTDEKLEIKAGSLNPRGIFENVASKIRVEKIMQAVKELSAKEQLIFSLRYISRFSYKKIGQMLGKPEAALRIMLYRLNKKLKKQLANENA